MITNKKLINNIPIINGLFRFFERKMEIQRLRKMSAENIFTNIFIEKTWKDKDSLSGRGSDIEQTKHIAIEIPKLMRVFNVKSLLDIPCGDFYWMINVDLKNLKYVGADIVLDLILQNKDKYEKDNIIFRQLNIIEDNLPSVDLILCRDCLVHFSFNDIKKSLRNIFNSQSKYLLTTTFPDRSENKNIVTGRWRTLNFGIAPFNFPQPLQIINEHCEDEDGKFKDKSLGLWRISDIKKYCL
jgi:hypothetical protein